MSKSAAVFLDRDGTINIDTGYVCRPEDLHLIPGVAAAIGDLRRNGFEVIVVTNQSAIGRGFATEDQVRQTNGRMEQLLLAADPDAQLNEILYCPHNPEDGCGCRKPLTGMFEQLTAVRRGGLDLAGSYMVGDKWSDLEFGIRLGIEPGNCFLVLTGHGEEEAPQLAEKAGRLRPDRPAVPGIFPTLVEVVQKILANR